MKVFKMKQGKLFVLITREKNNIMVQDNFSGTVKLRKGFLFNKDFLKYIAYRIDSIHQGAECTVYEPDYFSRILMQMVNRNIASNILELNKAMKHLLQDRFTA